ncbi:MAG TPA: cytochrome P450 [Candidatus Limnocylindrales bacterium]|jgi:cytochrome P450|nr:cytochrome P450 [Candidatus Limnocylindrales bacterium]
MTTAPGEIVLDATSPGFAADPYPAYAIARERAAVFRQPGDHLSYLTRYADVHAAFRDKRLGSTFLHRYTPEELGVAPGIPTWRDPRWTDFQTFERWELLNLEPPVHTRLRRLVLEAFTPRAVEGLRQSILDRARTLLAPGREAGQIDLVEDYAQAFSLGIICDLIGVSPDDRDTIKRLSDDTVSMYEPGPSDAQQAAANQAAGDFRRYLLDVVAHRRAHPGDDLMAALVDATVDGERLTDDQIVSTAMVLLMAGHEATVNATSNGIAALAANPDQWRLLRSGEVTVKQAIEEILRFDPPLQWFERWVLDDDVELAGAPVAKGSRVALVLGAANRDPRRFPDPDRFDITREDSQHISFGGGIHFCIGAPLARMEMETTLGELLATEEELVVLPGARRRPTFQFRGYERLEVALHSA